MNTRKSLERIWLENVGEYRDLYLKTDALLLSNVFEAFRNTCLENYKLDLAQFYTSPGSAWQECLKYTGIRLELLTNLNTLCLSTVFEVTILRLFVDMLK